MIRLSVNLNKIATLRNARGGNIPDVVAAARTCIAAGCHGITVHPRPDARHITFQDVFDLAAMLTVEFNIEGYPGAEFIELVLRARPTQVTLVPDPPGVLTSNAGWNLMTGEADWLGESARQISRGRHPHESVHARLTPSRSSARKSSAPTESSYTPARTRTRSARRRVRRSSRRIARPHASRGKSDSASMPATISISKIFPPTRKRSKACRKSQSAMR